MDSIAKPPAGASPEEKRVLLASLLRKKAQQAKTYPLSFAQERLWFIDQLVPDSSVYNLPAAVRLTGPLNVPALELTINEICRRHKSLTTTFPSIDGQPVQMVNPAQPISIPILDLSSWSVDERDTEARRIVDSEARKPFNLATGPLIRVQLLKLEEEEFIVMLTMHHIIADGWSMDVLMREIMVLYQALADGKPSPLPELPLQYADYARWQRQHLQGEILEAQLAYWRKQLAGIPPLLELPADHPRPPELSYRGTIRSLMLSTELSEALRALSRREETTLFNVMLTGFKTLLFRYTWQNDICIGTPIAGRGRVETEGLIGFFMNILVLRTRVSGDATFQELLRQVHEVSLEAHTHQDVPFEKVVEALHPERNMSYSPVFQVMFGFTNAGQTVLEIPGLKLSGYGALREAAKYDLLLGVTELRDRLSISLEYSTDLFEEERIERLLVHFRSLLESVVVDPNQHLIDIPLLQQSERAQILVEWNQTSAAYPADACMPQLFEQQVDERPEAPALIYGEQQISYRALEERSNQLAHYLRTEGVGPDTLVAVCLERSIEMVVTLLGVLKAGRAYLPLDASYPVERLRYMLEDSGAKLLVTTTKFAELFGETTRTLYVEGLAELLESHSRARVTSEVAPGHLAYVIYTSGSTGQPKGVMITHRGLVNYLHWARRTYVLSGERKNDRGPGSALHSSIGFDLSITSLWVPLMAGESVVLVAEELGLEGLLRSLREQGPFSLVKLTPSHLAVLNEQLRGEELRRSTRVVVIGGEALANERVRVWREQAPETRLINEYGPTETVVGCCVYEVNHETSWEGDVAIGRPIANTQLYVLDGRMQPVAVGVVGELYIGGEGLARGYLRRPELTAQKFVPHPFAENEGARLYRTGDLARYRSDGELEFLGRLDEQVKVRGYRIELGEIESVLRECEGVKEAVVVVEDADAEKRLIGYVVAETGVDLRVEQMRAQLREQLPEYMVPAVFMELEALPLTVNGKVDRRALPALGIAKHERTTAFTAPRNTLEIALAKVWEELLGVSPIGITDNFFDLGGSSILAVRMVALVEKQFGREVSLNTLFKGATIEYLAEVLSQKDGPQPWSPLVPIQPLGSKAPFFCVHAIGGQVLGFYQLGRYLSQDQPFYGIQAAPLMQVEDETSIEQMAAQYVAAVRVMQPVGPYRVGGFSFGGSVAFEMACQLQKQGQQVALLAVMDTPSPRFMHQLLEDDEADQLVGLGWVTARQKGKYLLLDAEVLRRLEPEERLDYFLKEMKKLDLTAQEAEVSHLRRFLVGFSARQRAQRKYFPRYSFPGAVTLFRCKEDDPETRKKLERAGLDADDPAYGWSGFSLEPVEIRYVDGHHNRMCEEPYVQDLAASLNAALESAQLSATTVSTV
jgi:amino acid adenylation domain-containing protein